VSKRLPFIVTAFLLTGALLVQAEVAAAGLKCGGKKATIKGTAGDDQLQGTARADVILGLRGHDVIVGAGGNDVICGGGGNDAMSGGPGSNRLLGGPGDDALVSETGNDVMTGSAGFDWVSYYYSQGPVSVDLGAGRASGDGADTLRTIENIEGSQFDDTLVGDAADNLVAGGLGFDTIATGAGYDLIAPYADNIDGGPDTDFVVYLYSPVPVSVDLSQGIAMSDVPDTLVGIEGVVDSEFDDTIVGDDSTNLFLTWYGNDEIDGRGGFDAILYWLADQPTTVDLDDGTAEGLGSDEIDNLEGVWGSNLAPNTLYGDSGNNILWGGFGDDRMYGGSGDDIIGGFRGNDLFDGGSGTFDIGTFCSCTDPIHVDMNSGIVTGPGNVELVGIEAIEGSPQNDVMIGNSAGNVFYGLAGDDQLVGNAGNDFLAGDDGLDSSDGGDGSDNCYASENALSCEGNYSASANYACALFSLRACQTTSDPSTPPLHPLWGTDNATSDVHANFKLNF